MVTCCPDFNKAMKEIKAQQIFCINQSMAPLYTSPKFSYCPFCGKKIVIEDHRKLNKLVENDRRKNFNLSFPYTKINLGFPIKGKI